MEAAATPRLEFRLLGPLEVWREGDVLRLGGERQRGLLAHLLLHANQVVPSEQLIEALFGDDASESARNALQAGVSRLRRILEPGSPTRSQDGILVTRPGGYLLHAAPEQLDVTLFERLHESGRRAFGDGDCVQAAVRLREALALWRGPALADLALLDFVQPEIRRLEELRLAALMDRVDADLALGRDAEVVPELEALVETNPLQERLRGQLMLALYRGGRQADALAVYRATRELLRDELGLEPSRALQELERAILQQEASLDAPEPARAETETVVCPFKGLASFERGDARFFCGRERVIADLVSRLAADSLVGIVGASGAGKSSILRAGLLPALAAGALPGSEAWRIALIRPGRHPSAELERALGASLEQALAAHDSDRRLLIAVDQLEEVVTACEDEQERRAFLDALETAARHRDGAAVVVVALRADYYGRFAPYRGFAELLSRDHVLVPPMERDELARAVELPATRGGLRVERRLVDALVGDVLDEPGALPLFSTTLLELWRNSEDRTLRYESYRGSGGVRGAVARLAESVYERLTPAEQAVARAIMLRLASGDADSAVRRRVPLAELESSSRPEVGTVLDVLVDARLLTVGDGAVEVSHEALLREWPRFRAWLDEDRAGRRLHEHLAASAREWADRNRDPAELYRGARLSATLDWAAAHGGQLNELERAFVDAGREFGERRQRRLRMVLIGVTTLLVLAVAAGIVAFRQRSAARHEATVALARELGAEAVSQPRIDQAMLLAEQAVDLDRSSQTEGTLLATLERSPAAVATFTTPIESRPQKIALSPDGRTLAVSDNTGDVRLYDTRTRRQRRVLHNLGFTNTVAYLPDGSAFLAFGWTKVPVIDEIDAHTLEPTRIIHWDTRLVKAIFEGTLGGYAPMLVSGDGRTLFYAYDILRPDGSDGPAFVDRWNLRTGKLVSTTPVGAAGANDENLIEGGSRLAVGGTKTVTILDTRTMRAVRSVHLQSPATINDEFVSPDGRTAAYGTVSGSVSFVDVATGRVTPGVGGHGAAVQAMRFSPDGRVVVSTGDDGGVIVWNPTTATPIERLVGHAGRVHGIAFSRDGKTLFTNSLDGAIFEWDLGGARRFGRPFATTSAPPLLGPDVPLTPPLALSPDGSEYAVRVGNSDVGLYSTRTAQLLRRFPVALGRDVTGLAWSPSPRGVLAVTGEGGVELWDVRGRPRPVRRLRGLPSTGQRESVQAVAFSPNGNLVAVGDANQTSTDHFGNVAVWNRATGTLLWTSVSKHSAVNTVAFSPDGRTVAVAHFDSSVALLDSRTGRTERILHLDGVAGFSSAVYGPDGTLATGTWAGILQRWRPGAGIEIGAPTLVAASPVASIAFDPVGGTFATTGGSDGLAKIWTTSTGQQFGATFPGDPGQWGNAQFTPDGTKLVVVYGDGKGFVWPATLRAWETHACAVAARNFTADEWRLFVRGHGYAKTCPQFPAG